MAASQLVSTGRSVPSRAVNKSKTYYVNYIFVFLAK